MFAHFQDFVDAFVGPFNTVAECDAHAEFCKKRGDDCEYLGAVDEVPEGGFIITPDEDRNYMVELKRETK